MHMVAANDRTAVTFSLSAGRAYNTPQGRELLAGVGTQPEARFAVMDRSYEGDVTRQPALELVYTPVVSPKSNRKTRGGHNRELYKKRSRGRAPVPSAEAIPPYLLPLRQTRSSLRMDLCES